MTTQEQIAQRSADAGEETTTDGFYPALDRFSAFSDGVFAIAITLLVLELPVPPEGAPLAPALLESWPDFMAYIISFAFIGGIWLTHSGLTRLMKRGDTIANMANLLLLLLVAILPFTTRVMVTHLTSPEASAAVFLYGANFLLASVTLSLLLRYIAREPSLLVDGIADATLKRITRQRWISIGVNSIALVVALFAPIVAVSLYLLEAGLLLLFPLVGMHRRKGRKQAQ